MGYKDTLERCHLYHLLDLGQGASTHHHHFCVLQSSGSLREALESYKSTLGIDSLPNC